ncbi:pilus assembly protein [Rhodoferax sp. PAMC 29310]|uniref:pilus assembly protein n=1 Tax=Rhodoferax sp. PAMC 29310 TaxID=2822760 RepID=UPI001B3403B5|nr:PilC/PilY family type IV pilus protein [Rhodoferax sp. PAMC 29310]
MRTQNHISSSNNGLQGKFAKFSGLLRPNLAWLLIPAVAVVSFVAISGTTAPAIPAITLSSDPLYAATAGDKPVLALALSVEFPTVGAQYVDPDNIGTSDDPTYSSDREYLGYYDAESCYTYDDAGTGAPSGQAAAYKRFVRRGPAIALATASTTQPTKTTRMCWNNSTSYTKDDGTTPASSTTVNDGFSGNFLNWASSSAIDMLRLSLTGGDRVIDTPTLTVLQRALIPDGNPIAMGNSNNFPAKRLYANGSSRAITSATSPSPALVSGVSFFGAVPSSMVSAAGGSDIFIANTLNRIYFGTSKSGNSSSGFGGYTLGSATGASQIDTAGITKLNASLPSDTTFCANEGGTCVLPAGTIKRIYYGANNDWYYTHATGSISCANAVFGDPLSGVGKQCYYRNADSSSTWVPASTSGLNSDGYFFSRVQVCDRNPSTYALKDNRDYDFCKKYSDGATTPQPNYKPAGAIQKYSDQLRLAAFGYLLDQTASYSAGRYGGVLRAPIKYVGSKTFDINGADNTASGGNPNQEWNPVTGVFYPNPDNNTTVACAAGADCSASYLSGVVSYVNQFGRTGSVRGRYKKFDPIGELHYETLRYLQGLQPSADAVSGITTDMYDGFPVSTSWTDPYGNSRSNTANYSCLKSNIVVIGDKNTHDGNRLPTTDIANNIPDISGWRTTVRNFEANTAATTYVDGQGVTRTSGNPNGANNSVPTSTTTSQIMGSAYWAHTHDIRGTDWTGTGGLAKQRPGLRVKTFMFDVNEYGGSNNAATRRSSNQLFMAAKYGGFEADASNSTGSPYNTWGNPFKRDDGTVDKYVWEDTDPKVGRPGEANTYFLQSNARGVLSAFDDIFSRAATAARSIAGSAIQSQNLTQAGNSVFQGAFDTTDWSGDLMSFAVTVTASTATPPNVVSIATTPTWKAADKLNALASPATSRNIVVGNRGATSSPSAVDFLWLNIETALQTDLNKVSPSSSSDGLGSDRLNYLRGDKSKESNPFRKRNSLLGDIINSGVAYSGAPTTSITSSTYASFYAANASRTPAVFVGANDGMLHAFDATSGNTTSGKELFAYIPSWMGPKLSALTAASYVNAHQSYVDSTPTVSEAEILNSSSALDWKTVLVSGTGNGGQGVFALDVTDPTAFSASKVMWEFTNVDDQDMGYVIGRPQILKMRTSAFGATTTTYKWFALVGSGANNYVTSVGGNFGSGQPTLFLLDLSKPASAAWSLGSNYFKVSLPVNATLAASNPTGLINFKAALGTAREVSQIYMGDLHGNLWKLDFSLVGSGDWNINKLSPFKTGSGSSTVPYPLFIAKDGAGVVQPITMAPSIANGPVTGSKNILFGTGKYLESADKTSTSQASFYMVYDTDSTLMDTLTSGATRASAISGRLRLKQGTSTAATATTAGSISVGAFTMGRATTDINTEIIRSGWYFDYAASGERQISSATLAGDSVVFGSLIPGGGSSASCSVSTGGGNQYTMKILSGVGSSVSSSVGILGEPLVANVIGATTETMSDSTGRRIRTVTQQVLQQGSSGLAVGRTTTNSIAVGRLSWRQIHNYRDLK